MRLLPILSIGFLVVILIAAIFFWWPQLQGYQTTKQELANKQLELQQKKDYFAKLQELSTKLTEYPQELAKIEFALPFDPNTSALFQFIQKESVQRKLGIKKLELAEDRTNVLTTSQQGIQQATFNATFVGPYAALRDLLGAIEQSSRLIQVDSLVFGQNKDAKSFKDFFTFDVTMHTYSYPQAQQIVSGTSH